MSDSIMIARSGTVIGTAGHIDHGKTSLIGALTGIDTDRLAEEKRRGISIDLGFAHLTLPSGKQISFVDVPGHERFIRNMLAGAGGIEAVLLIVAADEGVKPQTREHFEICRLLGIERGIVVLTKSDLATAGQWSATRAALKDLVTGSFLERSPVIPVSSVTGAGLDEVRKALEDLASYEAWRDAAGLARMPIDRSFALKGFGTVITGTLSGGTLRVGDTVELQPIGKEARIRGLQVHGESVPAASAGHRTAVNLSGVDHGDIERGFVLLSPKALEPTRMIHASVDWLPEARHPDSHEDFLLHIGTSEVSVHIKSISANWKERGSLVQLNLSDPVIASPGDRFVLRRPSPSMTIGGGVVVDAFLPKRLSRNKAASRLERLARADSVSRLEILVDEKQNGRTIAELVRVTGRAAEQVRSAILQSKELLLTEGAQRVVSRAWLARRQEMLVEFLKTFHAMHPSLSGAPGTQARLGLENALAHFVSADFGAIRMEGNVVALRTHRVQVSNQETAALVSIEQAFRMAGYQPASPGEILRTIAVDGKSGRGLLERLIKSAKLVRVSEELIFHADVIAHIRTSLSAHKGRRFSVPEFKTWTQVSRKYAIPLLEYLDHQRVTKRDGDNRIVL